MICVESCKIDDLALGDGIRNTVLLWWEYKATRNVRKLNSKNLPHSFPDTNEKGVRLIPQLHVQYRTCIRFVIPGWPGARSASLSTGIRARYAVVPVQVGSTESVSRFTSSGFPSAHARLAFSSKSERLTDDLMPSAPIRTSHVALDPSSKISSMGPESD